jgi:hypothetical protein
MAMVDLLDEPTGKFVCLPLLDLIRRWTRVFGKFNVFPGFFPVLGLAP